MSLSPLGRIRHHACVIEGPIYHLALAEDWARAPGDDYATSTLGVSLVEQGFIHCSFPQQVQRIADMVYRGRDDVLLLKIDPASLRAPVRVENRHGDEAFPHIYGPLNRDAVTECTPLDVLEDGRVDVAAAL